MKDRHEDSIRYLIEYVIEEGWSLWRHLPKKEASGRISNMVYKLIIINGYRFEKPDGMESQKTIGSI